MTLSDQIPVEYQLLNYEQLKEWPLQGALVELINHAFGTHAKGDKLFENTLRFETPNEFLDTVSPDGFMIVALANDDKGEPFVVAVSGAKPWTKGGEFRDSDFGISVKWHKSIEPRLKSDSEWELISTAVLYNDERFHKRGLVGECNRRIYEELFQRSQSKEITVVAVATEMAKAYWDKQGFTTTDEALALNGSYRLRRDFMWYILQKKIARS